MAQGYPLEDRFGPKLPILSNRKTPEKTYIYNIIYNIYIIYFHLVVIELLIKYNLLFAEGHSLTQYDIRGESAGETANKAPTFWEHGSYSLPLK